MGVRNVLMKEAAVDAAREERAASIQDGEQAKVMARQEAIEIIELPAAETEKFIEATKTVYEKYKDFFSPGLIDKIKAN